MDYNSVETSKKLKITSSFDYWRNFLFHGVEGGLYMGGLAFVDSSTVMPPLIQALGGPSWLISLMPAMTMLGFVWPPIFTAHIIERLYWFRPLILITGIFQRLPYLLAAVVLMLPSGNHSLLVILIVALAPFISGMFGGISLTAWQQFVAKTIPRGRLSSLWALRQVISASIGICAGGIITLILEKVPGLNGYGLLHILTFCFLLVSYIVFAHIKEFHKENPDNINETTLRANLRSMPDMVRRDSNLRYYLLTRTFFNGIFIMAPFLSIYTLETSGKGRGFIGYLVTSQMAGSIAGNFLSGYLGDRYGSKIPMYLSRFALIALCVLIWAKSTWVFIALFFLYGLAVSSDGVGTSTLSIEIAPSRRKATSLALMSAINVPSMVVASLVGSCLWDYVRCFPVLLITSTVFIILSTISLLPIGIRD